MKNFFLLPVSLLGLLILSSCQSRVNQSFAWNEETMAWRQQQTRRFDTLNEKKVIQASASLLQDLGFTLSESEVPLGVLTATKDRSAVEAGQVVGAFFLSALAGTNVAHDTAQTFRASIVTRPQGKSILVRVTFQRVVYNSHNQISRLERLNDPKQYSEFFSKLSKSFL